jgi:hypothetical protein
MTEGERNDPIAVRHLRKESSVTVEGSRKETRVNAPRRLVRILVTATVLGAIVLGALRFSPSIAAAQGIGIVDGSVTSEPYGTFNGIAYVKYNGRFMGLASGAYDVPFEIIAPADPGQGNGITIMEPFRPEGQAGGLKGYLTPAFLLGRGFSHAGIGWHEDGVAPQPGGPTAQATEILYNFGMTLREDDVARNMVGEVQMLYSTGVSLATAPLLALLASDHAGVLDFSFLFVPTLFQETYSPHEDANKIMVFLTESDLVRAVALGAHTDVLRGSSPIYRSYEVAGGPHIPDVPWVRALGWGSEGTTPLDWTPVARALFLAGHRWTQWGIEPPPSAYLNTEAPEGQIDPVYWSEYGLELETGIAREENGNALGGIRMPDLAVGRGQYIAFDPTSFFGMGLFGTWQDLQCEPLADGSIRFPNHGSYVSQFAHQADKLVAQGYLLPVDADRLISDAAKSDIGKPNSCPP